jgi:signal transduction histidine kinase
MPRLFPHFALILAAIAALVSAIFAAVVLKFRHEFQADIEQRISERDAAVLYPVVLQKLAEREGAKPGSPPDTNDLLAAVLQNPIFQESMLGIVVFDPEGRSIQAVPSSSLLFADLSIEDYLRLQTLKPISRFHPDFALDQYFLGVSGRPPQPVLEILMPLHGRGSAAIVGFVQYFINAQPLAIELAQIKQRNRWEITVTLLIGILLIFAIVFAAYFALARAQQAITERNARLTRANFELTLAAKVSALGQITSHLIHGLQGPVAGLRAFVADRGAAAAAPEWQTAANYAERMQAMIHEAVALLGDASAHASYEISGYELAALISARNLAPSAEKGVILQVSDGFPASLDSHRGSLICLITSNLVQNAIAATAPGKCVRVELAHATDLITVTVIDQGTGIPLALRDHLFEPGRTGRAGGSGLGLAISRLLARQIAADLSLQSTTSTGTTFRLRLPLSG